MIFSGSLVDDRPEGHAICFYEGEYEECRFFRGKRIDTLYKIRKENAKHQFNAQPVQQAQTKQAYPQQKGMDDYATDALKREGASRAASFVFDLLW